MARALSNDRDARNSLRKGPTILAQLQAVGALIAPK
jgi:hypothetical protein